MKVKEVIESSEPVDQEILHELKNKSSFKESAKCDDCCGGIIGEIGMTLMHCKWFCDLCQDKEKRGIL